MLHFSIKMANIIKISIFLKMFAKVRIIFSLICCFANCNSTYARKTTSNGRIFGGQKVNIRNYPYQVSLQFNGEHFCGGSIVSVSSVVTAAHCAPWDSIEKYTIRAGTSSLASGGITINILQFIRHGSYNSVNQDYDIAVVKLANYLTFTDKIKPIPLATAVPPDSTKVTISGWGRTHENALTISSDLEAVSVPLVNSFICKVRFPSLTERMICAGDWTNGGVDACQGDSGGPMVYGSQLLGIISYGVGCARAYYPGVYANIANSEINQFIQSYMF